MWKLLLDNKFVFIFALISVVLLAYVLYLRWRMSTSKSRFALAAMSLIVSCLLSLYAFLAGPLLIQCVNLTLALVGVDFRFTAGEPSGLQSAIAIVATIV